MSLSFSCRPVKLDTSGTGDGEHYDQVFGISQAAINNAFIKLFEKQPPAARSVHWENQSVFHGKLVATMLPPQIELDVESEDSRKFLLQLRFEKGRVFLGQNDYQTIDGWVIAFSLSFEECLNESIGDLASAETLEDMEEDVEFRSDKPTKIIPGEYSIHRLFAAIADLTWGSIIWERSYMTQAKGQKFYLDKWARNPANNALYNEVQQCLREWTLENKLASCFTQGMLLKVPKAKVSSGKVTFAARTLHLQNYPYIEEEKQIELSGTNQAMKGKNGSPYNCLCFCEVVRDRVDLPKTRFLPFSGNLAGPSKGTSGEYLGTFVLDHRLFSGGDKLLSQLRELCHEMQTKTSSMPKITIEAGPQMTAFKVSGEYRYSRPDELPDRAISDIVPWSFTISIKSSQDTAGNLGILNNISAIFTGCKKEQDVLSPSHMLVPNDLPVNLAEYSSDPKWVIFRRAMKINIGTALAKMASDFKSFLGIPKLIYPGSSELKFGPTMLNGDMNLFATIDFSLKESRVNWQVPKTENLGNKVSDRAYISDTSVTTNTAHLTWTFLVNTYDTSSRTIKSTLTGLNNSNDAMAFKCVSILCLRMKALDGKTLFAAEPEHWAAKDVSNTTLTDTWSISTTKIDQELNLKAGNLDSGLQFTIFPEVLGTTRDGTDLPTKFIIPPKGFFTLELSGAVSTKDNAGLYVMQFDEVWTGVRPSRPVQGRASTFLLLELRADGRHQVHYPVTQAVADITRGVSHT